MKNVLMLAHDDIGQEARLQAALDATRALEGHLTCLDAALLPPSPGLYTGEAVAMLLAEECERETKNRSRLEARLAKEDVSWDWVEMTGDAAECIKEHAGLADLIVVNRKLEAAPLPDALGIAGEVIVNGHRPVLAVPENATGFNVQGTALIAWDGSEQAAAALTAAIPLLRIAGQVRLLEIDDGSVTAPAEEAATYLSRHGIKPVIVHAGAERGKAGKALLAAVEEQDADYVVMGGFGRPRPIEIIFGGATRAMLCHSPVPVLFAR